MGRHKKALDELIKATKGNNVSSEDKKKETTEEPQKGNKTQKG